MKQQELKEIKLPLKWNIAEHKYQPQLPIIKKGKKNEIKLNGWWVIILLAILVGIFILGFWISN